MKTTDAHADQRGQATPLVLVVLAFAALLSVGVVRLGTVATDRAAAQAAADAVALAGAAEGQEVAERVAGANRAEVVSFRMDDVDTVVTVRRHGVTATARARWEPTPIP